MFQGNGTGDRHAAVLAGALVAFCAAMGQAAIVFHDQTAESGIAFVHSDGGCEKKYIMEMSARGWRCSTTTTTDLWTFTF